MNKIVILLICIFSFGASAQNFWTDAETDHFFELLSQNPATAVSEVESHGVTPFDFGMDLVAMEQNEAAFHWFVTLAQEGEDTRNYLLGMAWVQMDNQNLGGAMSTANLLLGANSPPLTDARAHYMLGVIFKYVGSVDLALTELTTAQELYQSIGKEGGVVLCIAALNAEFKSTPSNLEDLAITPRRADHGAFAEALTVPTIPFSTFSNIEGVPARPPRDDDDSLLQILNKDVVSKSVTAGANPPRDDTGSLFALSVKNQRLQTGANSTRSKIEGSTAPPPRDDDDSSALTALSFEEAFTSYPDGRATKTLGSGMATPPRDDDGSSMVAIPFLNKVGLGMARPPRDDDGS